MRRPGSRGTFQQLGQFVGVGFDGKDPKAVEALCAHDPDEGIFVWTRESIICSHSIQRQAKVAFIQGRLDVASPRHITRGFPGQ